MLFPQCVQTHSVQGLLKPQKIVVCLMVPMDKRSKCSWCACTLQQLLNNYGNVAFLPFELWIMCVNFPQKRPFLCKVHVFSLSILVCHPCTVSLRVLSDLPAFVSIRVQAHNIYTVQSGEVINYWRYHWTGKQCGLPCICCIWNCDPWVVSSVDHA